MDNNQVVHKMIRIFRNLKGNPLHCNCEMKRFKDWAFLRTGQVTLLEAKCANKKNLPLFDITDFGLCTGEKTIHVARGILT